MVYFKNFKNIINKKICLKNIKNYYKNDQLSSILSYYNYYSYSYYSYYYFSFSKLLKNFNFNILSISFNLSNP
jgi:hypothetical protein